MVIDLQPLPDAAIDCLGTSAATDYEHHQVTSIRPRTLLCLLAEVKASRLAALSDQDKAALAKVRDLVEIAGSMCVGRAGAERGLDAATRGLAVLDRLLGIGGC